MTPAKFIGNLFLGLLPFIITTVLHFVLWWQTPNAPTAILKVLPIYSLVLFVLVKGHRENSCWLWILLGLLVSSVGDVFMVWRSQLVNGMAAFALGQLCYIKAFGFTPLEPKIAAALFASSSAALLLLVPGLKHDTFLLAGLPVYCLLLTTMAWRACARFYSAERTCKWIRLCTAVGSIFFLISDMIIGFDRFFLPIQDAQMYIMATYYIAQVGIAVSAAEPRPAAGNKKDKKRV